MHKKYSTIAAFAIILLFSSCASQEIVQSPATHSGEFHTIKDSSIIYGIWNLNKEKTLRSAYSKRSTSWEKLTQSKRNQLIAGFDLSFTMIFTGDGKWSALYKTSRGSDSAQGSYTVTSIQDKSVTVQTVNEKETQILQFNFIDENSALLIIESKAETAEFIIEKNPETEK
jgi:hypothetical protein